MGSQDKHTGKEELRQRLTLPEYPRSATYDPAWVLENMMGPNVLWLAESLSQVMDLRPGMRLLDLGCGRATSSIFLAREFGVQVWATDLWIRASDNWARIKEAHVDDRVFPIHAEAHSLPFANDFFDAAVSLDAYHYFGTDDLYLRRFAALVKPGGQLGLVVPGLRAEFDGSVPSHLAQYWEPEFWSFHSPDWWARHWTNTGPVKVERADLVPAGWRQWLLWMEVCRDAGYPPPNSGYPESHEIPMLTEDAGRSLGFTRLVATRV